MERGLQELLNSYPVVSNIHSGHSKLDDGSPQTFLQLTQNVNMASVIHKATVPERVRCQPKQTGRDYLVVGPQFGRQVV